MNFGRVVCRRAAPLADGYERALCAWRHGRVDDAKNAFGARPNPAPLRTSELLVVTKYLVRASFGFSLTDAD